MANKGSWLASGAYLGENDYLVSDNGQYFVIMQADGNFALYQGNGPSNQGKACWSTNTGGKGQCFAIMQNDGNFVIYQGSDPAHQGAFCWNAGTVQGQCFAIMQNDGNFVIYQGSDPAHQGAVCYSVPLQAVTAAISVKGIKTFFTYALTQLMGASLSAPDKPGVVKSESIPAGLMIFDLDNLDLAKGSVSQVKATLASCAPTKQNGSVVPGSYTISLSASFSIAYSVWHETGKIITSRKPPDDFDSTLSDFYFTVTNVDMTFDVQIAAVNNAWAIKVTNPQQANVTINDHIPDQSILNSQYVWSCVHDRIVQTMASTLQNVDYASAMADAVNNLLKTIPNSGHLTDKIVFQFPPTSLALGTDGSLQAGISGGVLYDGAAYGGASVSVPLPPVTEHDVQVYVNNYEFDALLWAFQKNGSLSTTVLSSQAPDELNTTFLGAFIPPLKAKFGEGKKVDLQIDSVQAPLTYNQITYVLTNDAADRLNLPATTRSALNEVVGVLYLDTQSFVTALQSVISPDDYKTYGQVITKALTNEIALFADSQFLISIIVEFQEVQTFAFSFTLARQDSVRDFVLGVKGSTQTLQFAYEAIGQSATLVKSDIGPIDPQNFLSLWVTFDVYVNHLLANAGTTGVALPSLGGFLFDNTTITLFDKNVGVDTDVFYGNVAQLLHARSRRERRGERAKRADGLA